MVKQPIASWVLLCGWTAIAAGLRLVNLTDLPPWTDECATIVFSLGNHFGGVPLDRFLDADTLLAPFQLNSDATARDTVRHLLAESTHPPLYFLLSHGWLHLFPNAQGWVSLWGARSLSALFGIATVPAMFGFGRLAFGSPLAGQVAAALAALSPFGIFLAREARHYTLAVLLVIAALSCFVIAIRCLFQARSLPIGIGISWVAIAGLGVATHYFFVLSLGAQGLVLLGIGIRQGGWRRSPWPRLYWVAFGVLAAALVWLPLLPSIRESPATQWVYDGEPRAQWYLPLLRLVLWGLSAIALFPSGVTAGVPVAIAILSGIATSIYAIWLLSRFNARHEVGIKDIPESQETRWVGRALGSYVLATIALFLAFTYGLQLDLTLASRYTFVYYPAAIALISWGLVSHHKTQGDRFPNRVWRTTAIVLLVAFLGGLTAIGNLGYLQNHRPDLMAREIASHTNFPSYLVTAHKHHGQTGRLMGIAWELRRHEGISLDYFLAHRPPEANHYQRAIAALQNQLSQRERPFDLWLVDFRSGLDLSGCDRLGKGTTGEYRYRHYRCQ